MKMIYGVFEMDGAKYIAWMEVWQCKTTQTEFKRLFYVAQIFIGFVDSLHEMNQVTTKGDLI